MVAGCESADTRLPEDVPSLRQVSFTTNEWLTANANARTPLARDWRLLVYVRWKELSRGHQLLFKVLQTRASTQYDVHSRCHGSQLSVCEVWDP